MPKNEFSVIRARYQHHRGAGVALPVPVRIRLTRRALRRHRVYRNVGKSHDYVCICAGRRARPANGGLSAIRGTGKAIPANELKTYAEALAQCHLRPEAKFLNGDFCDRGRTERRHVVATQLLHIGKEANKWEEQHFLGEVKARICWKRGAGMTLPAA